jgi:putative hydrolase of the HAD superfamily
MITSYPKDLTQKTYDTVIFDLGGVLVEFNPHAIATVLGDRIKTLSPQMCRTMMLSEPFRRNALGLISFEEAHEELYNFFPATLVDVLKTVNLAPALRPLPGAEKLFNLARKKARRIYILSNITPISFEHINATTPFIREADGSMVSFIAKSRKPDPGIYQALINLYTITPQTALFFDDLEENCKAAYDLGIDSIVYDHNNQDIEPFFAALKFTNTW